MAERFIGGDGSFVEIPASDSACKKCGNGSERTLESKFDGESIYQRITCKKCGEKTCRKFRITEMDVRFGGPAPMTITVPKGD